MLASRLFIHTDRETPAEAEVVSHRLMLRAGFVRQLAGGIYSWLPLGWRVAAKIAAIVREEMDGAGAAEVFLPAVQPADLWKKSGRWEVYGDELLRFSDRHRREFCFGPTHEEVVTDIVRASAKSYRQLPFNLYQIQTKFRDEIRPRFGVMRAREFIMKDAYSFDADADGMRESYEAMRAAYCRIFDRVGLSYRMVEADSGAIGGSHSHEFMVLADSGEEAIVYCDAENYAANVERAQCAPPAGKTPAAEGGDEKNSHPRNPNHRGAGRIPGRAAAGKIAEDDDCERRRRRGGADIARRPFPESFKGGGAFAGWREPAPCRPGGGAKKNRRGLRLAGAGEHAAAGCGGLWNSKRGGLCLRRKRGRRALHRRELRTRHAGAALRRPAKRASRRPLAGRARSAFHVQGD